MRSLVTAAPGHNTGLGVAPQLKGKAQPSERDKPGTDRGSGRQGTDSRGHSRTFWSDDVLCQDCGGGYSAIPSCESKLAELDT